MNRMGTSDSKTQPPWTLYTERQRWRLLAILFLVSTSCYVDRNVLSVLLEPIKHEFQVSDTLLGLLGGFSFALFYALFGVPVARWADRGNRRKVITAALSVWSVMTVVCGLVHSFWYLVLARVGVGAGESGAIPPAQSLIADYFPPERRASAMAIFMSSAMLGYLLGFSLGGYIAASHGWRAAFLAFGAPGLVLALITHFGLAEPRLALTHPVSTGQAETWMQSLQRLRTKPSFRYALLGCIVYFFVAYGALIFIPSYLIRVLHVPLAKVSLTVGAVGGAGSLLGTLAGGWFADRLVRHDIRWLAWLPAAACALAGPMYCAALATDRFWIFVGISGVAGILLAGGLPPVFAAIHAICGSSRRALAIAIVLFSATLLGGGFGPLLSGALSDALRVDFGEQSLRPALMAGVSLLVVTGGLFYRFGCEMPHDLED